MHPGPMNRGVEIDSAVADGGAGGDPAAGHLRHRRAHGGDEHAGGELTRMKIHIKNGRLIDPASIDDKKHDVFIAAGRIVGIGTRRPASLPTASSTRRAASSAPAWSTSPPACASRASNTRPRWNPKWRRGRRRRDQPGLPAGHRSAAGRTGPGRDAQAPRPPARVRPCLSGRRADRRPRRQER
jgi:hypothetical protein